VRRQHHWTSRLTDGPHGIYAALGVIGAAWLLGVITSGDSLTWLGAVTLVGGVGYAWWWERTHLSRRERRIIAWWTDACQRCRIYNVPAIRLKTPGRLDARWSATSLTLQVEVERPRAHDTPDEKAWTILKSLQQLAGLADELKMVMGTDVSDVRVKPNRGNHATVVVVYHIEGARKVLIGVAAGGVGTEISVLDHKPNPAWVHHAAFGGYVLAKHRHATEHHPTEGDGWNGTLDLDDDDDGSWWQADADDEPQSGAPIDELQSDRTDSDHGKSGCYEKEGRGETNTPPWPAPNGPPYHVEAA
jgi:hypothetical protein